CFRIEFWTCWENPLKIKQFKFGLPIALQIPGMLRSKLHLFVVLMVTPLLVSPWVLKQEAARGLASVGVVTLPQGFAGAGAFSQVDFPSLLKTDEGARSSFQYFHNFFGQASLSYLDGLQ